MCDQETCFWQVVAPKRAALAEANKRLDGANKKLSGIRAHVAELRERVALLEASLMKVHTQSRVSPCMCCCPLHIDVQGARAAS